MLLVFYLTFDVIGAAFSTLLDLGIGAVTDLTDRALTAYGTDGNQRLLLQKIQRWVDDARAWGVIPLGQIFNRFNQLVTVAVIARENIQNHQTQFTVTKETLPTTAAATVATTAALTVFMLVTVSAVLVF